MLASLSPEQFTVRDIYIDKQGVWHERGRATTPADVLRTLDVALIGLHGEYGEDGEVQKILERAGVPYTGSDALSSFTAMHKVLAKERAKELGIRTAEYRFIESVEDIEPMVSEAVRTFMQPVVVKPLRWGSSVGVSLLSGYAPIHSAALELFEQGAEGVLIEEYIRGTEATAGVVENVRGEELYALPLVEIIPPQATGLFSYSAKYSGETREICPARFPKAIELELADSARRMHKALGLRHYSRSDFIVSPRGIYYLETNSLPAMTGESLFPKSLSAVGISLSDFFSHIVGLALTNT
jgi:D-alanine-D-alanine ligase